MGGAVGWDIGVDRKNRSRHGDSSKLCLPWELGKAVFRSCDKLQKVDSPGRKLLKSLLLVLGAHAGSCAEAGGGDYGARRHGLRAGSDDIRTEEAGGAASGSAEDRGGHFFSGGCCLFLGVSHDEENCGSRRAGGVVRRAIGGVGAAFLVNAGLLGRDLGPQLNWVQSRPVCVRLVLILEITDIGMERASGSL